MRAARISILHCNQVHVQEEDRDILTRAVTRIRKVGRDRPDLILLSELFANHARESNMKTARAAAQAVPGLISEELAALARRFGTYIAFGLLRRSGPRVYNSLVLLDRKGKPRWIYDKVAPVASEMTACGVAPGRKPKSFRCDFGRVGGAICFDINFFELAELYFRQEVELILFSSMFPAGRLLDAWTVRYGFHLAGSTWYAYNRIIDCTGATVAQTSDILPYATAVLNLNRRVVHMDGNLEKLDRMRSDYAGDVLIEDLRNEATCVITSLKKGLEVANLIRRYRIETLPAYLDRSRRVRARRGGLPMPRWA